MTFKELYPGVFSVEYSNNGYYVDYKVLGENFLYLHTDLTLHDKAYCEGPGAYVPTRAEACLLVSQFQNKVLKKHRQGTQSKGITIKYEKVILPGFHEYRRVRILSVAALGKKDLPNEYVLGAPEAVWFAEKDGEKGLENHQGRLSSRYFFMREGQLMPYSQFKRKMAYIAKAGHNLATIKEARRKEAEERKNKKVKKDSPWQGVKTVSI